MSDLVPAGQSPFDQIRQEDERGEYWTGRDLMPLHGYDKWERFAEAIERVRVTLANTGQDPDLHASRLREPSGQTQRVNYRLSRHAAYLIAMNADSRKPEVAAAQVYFAAKTREAEIVQQQIPQDYAAALRAAADEHEARLLAEAKVAELEPRLEAVEAKSEEQRREIVKSRAPLNYLRTHVDARKDTTTFTTMAKQLGMRSGHQLYIYLEAIDMIYQRTQGRRRTSRGWEDVKQWLPRAGYEHCFRILDQPEAPPLHNDQKPTTLYILPPGKVEIADKLAERPIDTILPPSNVTKLPTRRGKKKPGGAA